MWREQTSRERKALLRALEARRTPPVLPRDVNPNPPMTPHGLTRLRSLEQLKACAAAKGGECLAHGPVHGAVKTWWRCKERHEWPATPNSVVGSASTWCPECVRLTSLIDISVPQEAATARGGVCLAKSLPEGTRSIVEWRCSRKHTFSMRVASVLYLGHWCLKCAPLDGKAAQNGNPGRRAKNQKTLAEVRALAAKHRGTYEETRVYPVAKSVRWCCEHKHHFRRSITAVSQGVWCPKCATHQKSHERIARARERAEQQGGECLATVCHSDKTKLRFRCSEHGVFSRPYFEVCRSDGRGKTKWCPDCAHKAAGMRRCVPLERLQEAATSKGGRCLATAQIPTTTKCDWECESGHRWTAVPAPILYGRTWCPMCAKIARRRSAIGRRGDGSMVTLADLKQVAEERGGRLRARVFRGLVHTYVWSCAADHSWPAPADAVLGGRWCPDCAGSLGERMARLVMESVFGVPFPKSRPTFLRSPRGRPLELDGYAEKLKVAFEHQGKHHQGEGRFALGDGRRERISAHDDLKRAGCSAAGVVLVEIPSLTEGDLDCATPNERIEAVHKAIAEAFKAAARKLPRGWRRIGVDLSKAYRERGIVAQLIPTMKAHHPDAECLTPYVALWTDKVSFNCGRGHTRTMTARAIRAGQWCQSCRHLDRERKWPDEEIRRVLGEQGYTVEQIRRGPRTIYATVRCARGHSKERALPQLLNASECRACTLNYPSGYHSPLGRPRGSGAPLNPEEAEQEAPRLLGRKRPGTVNAPWTVERLQKVIRSDGWTVKSMRRDAQRIAVTAECRGGHFHEKTLRSFVRRRARCVGCASGTPPGHWYRLGRPRGASARGFDVPPGPEGGA